MSKSLAAWLDALEARTDWQVPLAFLARADAIDALDLALVGERDAAVARRGGTLLAAMEAVDQQLFALLRERVRAGEGRTALAPWLEVGFPTGSHYDPLDTLLAGVLALDAPQVDAMPLPADMVFYQPTPARHIVHGIARARLREGETLLDLGSGLGHVGMLAHLITGALCLGVEREPAYVAVAQQAAAALGLGGARFTAGDARDAVFDGVDVFWLFTPFIGAVLRDVVAKMAVLAARRPIRVVALGPCTRTLARQPWLRSNDPDPEAGDRIVLFQSA